MNDAFNFSMIKNPLVSIIINNFNKGILKMPIASQTYKNYGTINQPLSKK